MRNLNKKIFNSIFNKVLSTDYSDVGEKGYILFHKDRFFKTFRLLYDFIGSFDHLNILEVGPKDYFMSNLIYEISGKTALINCIEHPDAITTSITTDFFKNKFHTYYFDLEKEKINLEKKYDLILCCEVIEHLIYSPTNFLYNLHLLLKDNGVLLITTDNVCRITNLIKLMIGENVFYYIQPAICFRHNREYTFLELEDLLKGINFNIVKSGYFNFIPFLNSKIKYFLTKILFALTNLPLMRSKKRHLFFLLKKKHPPTFYYPNWLYESPEESKRIFNFKN